MPFYLSQYIGSGTQADPFRPAGSGVPGWSSIDLRPRPDLLDGGGLNACLLWSPTAISDPQATLLADTKDSPLSNQQRNFVQNRLGVDLTGVPNTFGEIVGHILLNPPATNKWGILFPSGGRFQIWLGGLIYDKPAR